MLSKTINEIIYSELSKVYRLCVYVPSLVQYEQFLETLPKERKAMIRAKYQDSEVAYNKLFIYRHWYIQKHHKREIDSIMEMVLLPDIYKIYLKRYQPQTD